MKLYPISAVCPAREGFGEPVHVQGGEMRTRGGSRLVESGGRFKLFCEGQARLFLLAGEGHIKWARGETPFAAGSAFALEETGELEVNGICTFLFEKE